MTPIDHAIATMSLVDSATSDPEFDESVLCCHFRDQVALIIPDESMHRLSRFSSPACHIFLSKFFHMLFLDPPLVNQSHVAAGLVMRASYVIL